MAKRACDLGYDGLDFVVRDGFPVTPATVEPTLGPAIKIIEDNGLSCPLLTGDVTLIDPWAPGVERLFAAASDSGVPMIKLGYFVYRPGDDFDAVWSRARAALEGFAGMAERHNVKAVYHTHNGFCLGSTAAGLRHLLDGFDPDHLGAYVDPGHLAVNGEDMSIALPMLRRKLAVLAAKDAHHVLDRRPGAHPAYHDAFVEVGRGRADWVQTLALLASWRWDGPISVHTEYTDDANIIATVGGRDDSQTAGARRDQGERTDLQQLRAWKASAMS